MPKPRPMPSAEDMEDELEPITPLVAQFEWQRK
jgi:hypothetical protein